MQIPPNIAPEGRTNLLIMPISVKSYVHPSLQQNKTFLLVTQLGSEVGGADT